METGKRKTSILKLVVAAQLLYVAAAHATTFFSYSSSPTSWVGGGESVMVSPADGFDFLVFRNFDQGISFAIDDFATNPDFFSTRWWNLDFAAPLDVPLTVGHYVGATRFPFQDASRPGLDFSGNGNGDNTLTGSFDVFEVRYSLSGDVLAFAADFVQFDEGIEDRWSCGIIRYNSSIDLQEIPEPASILLLAPALAFLATVGLWRQLRAPDRRLNLHLIVIQFGGPRVQSLL